MNIGSTLHHLFHPQRSNNHRPRVLQPRAFIFFSAIALGFFGILHQLILPLQPMGLVLGFSSSITPVKVIEQTNQERAKLGLLPLKINDKLTRAALAKGQDMFSDQYWAHVAPDGKEPWSFIGEAGYTYKVAGENLARDFFYTGDMVKAWMSSPTHRANIANDRYREVGIAVIDGVMAGHETTLVVQMFGSPQQVAVAVDSTNPKSTDNLVKKQPALESDQLSFSEPVVLASAMSTNDDFVLPPLFSALQLTKAFFLGLIMMIVLTLFYDGFVIGHRDTARMVGKNLAHIIFLIGVSFLLIFFKGGIVG